MLYQHKNSVGVNFYECIRHENFNFVPHMHRHPELIHVYKGQLIIASNNSQETLEEGEFALILPNQIHDLIAPGYSLIDVCIFSQDYAPAFFHKTKGQIANQTRFICSPSISEFLIKELFSSRTAPDFYLMKSLIYAALYEYDKQVIFTHQKNKKISLLEEIVNYVAKNYTENISLKNMAQELGYEPHYLSRYFHSNINMHFSQYVNWYRIDNATQLLHNTELPITQIADQSGFQSIRSFNRVYREFTGQTPSESLSRQKNIAIEVQM